MSEFSQHGPNIQTAVLLADFPKTNDTLTAVPDLTLNLEAGRWYRVTGMFFVDATSDSGAVMDFNGGSVTATGVGGSMILRDETSTSISWLGNLSDAFQSAEFMMLVCDFEVQVNAGGTLIPRVSQQTTHATVATLKKYATISAQDVTPQ